MLPSGLPELVADEENLARFLTQSSQFNSTMVKPAAFLPNPKDWETSVSRHGPEPREGLWELGAEAVAAGGRSLHGAALLKARAVRDAPLEVAADEPPPRHAVICNWPIETDPDLRKAKHKELAIRLASAAGKPLLR
jgi:hypothetical protein